MLKAPRESRREASTPLFSAELTDEARENRANLVAGTRGETRRSKLARGWLPQQFRRSFALDIVGLLGLTDGFLLHLVMLSHSFGRNYSSYNACAIVYNWRPTLLLGAEKSGCEARGKTARTSVDVSLFFSIFERQRQWLLNLDRSLRLQRVALLPTLLQFSMLSLSLSRTYTNSLQHAARCTVG